MKLTGDAPAHVMALHVLLEERHVTRAARRMGMTQSSMSHRLGLLRRLLDDPLFVRDGRSLVPTPRAESLKGPVAEAVAALEAALLGPQEREPVLTTLSVAMPDLLVPLAGPLMNDLAVAAPRCALHLTSVGPGLGERLVRGEPAMALVPKAFAKENVVHRVIGDLSFGVAGRAGHPVFRRRLTVESWLGTGHVVVNAGQGAPNLVEEALAARALQRRVALEVPSFLAGLMVVKGSELLMNVPLPLASSLCTELSLEVRAPPIPLPRPRFVLCWHPRFQKDRAHRRARDLVFESVQSLFKRAPGRHR
jgi:DNA-binding transcriptional LysR family regulator